MRDTLVCCKSTPVTACPISAKHAAVTQPTYPIPKTVIFIGESGAEVLGFATRGDLHCISKKLSRFSWCRVPESAVVTLTDIFQERSIISGGIFHPVWRRAIKA